ncbi:MAG TPA: hypothetical protein VE968_02840 [Sphingomicrobium sp.]|nr:hypothetical protein [Sphingomicrobium sp.]
MRDDAAYYRSRAQEEIAAAVGAEPTSARKAHLELAQRYQDLATAIELRDGAKTPDATAI